MKKFFVVFLLCISAVVSAQELNAVVIINAEQTGQSNLQVFRTLERELTEFMNQTRWTDKDYKQQERIDCSFNIIVSRIDSDFFEATIQVQSSRPVYNSNYDSPVFNYNDKQFAFNYVEFQPLVYNPNTFSSNLVSVMAFYAYTIIGFDAHTFELNAGEPHFQEARRIVNIAQSSGSIGWAAKDGVQSRYRLNDDLLSPNFRDFSDVLYSYHRNGLDYMTENLKASKESVAGSLLQMKTLYNKRPNNFLSRVFFDAKAEEIASMFAGGPQVNVTELIETLNRVAPTKSTYWRQIKF